MQLHFEGLKIGLQNLWLHLRGSKTAITKFGIAQWRFKNSVVEIAVVLCMINLLKIIRF